MLRLHPIPAILFLFLFFQTPIFGKTIYVNASVQGGSSDGTSWVDAYSNLSFGLFYATYGDTIWVAQGTYFPTGGTNRNLSFTLKNGVKLYGGFNGTEIQQSQRDWEANETILSGDIGIVGDSTDNSYTVVFCDDADSTTELNGFIITGGNADEDSFGVPHKRQKSGGGMYIVGSSPAEDTRPVIMNCKFVSNYAKYNGGGIYIRTDNGATGNPTILDCDIYNNKAFNGGGISWEGGSHEYDFIVKYCNFYGNRAEGFGGGMNIIVTTGEKKIAISKSLFYDNYSVGDGGAIHYELQIAGQEFTIKECDFVNNLASFGIGQAGIGGAIQYYFIAASDHIEIDKSTFINNESKVGIIGVLGAFEPGNLKVSNSLFDENQGFCFNIFDASLVAINTVIKGSPIGEVSSSSIGHADFYNCTFVDNLKNDNSLFSITGTNVPSTLDFRNCISYGNFESNHYLVTNYSNISEVSISNSLVDFPNCTSLYNSPAGNNINCGPGMLYNADPLFADTTADDFSLLPNSPCINAGDNTPINDLNITTDLAGNPRIICGTVDMGAYEFISSGGNIIYVNKNVQGGNQDGSSWANAFSDLQDALATACHGDSIWVAQGIYLPTTGADRNISFELPNGVKLFGGFDGTEVQHSDRDWEANETVLSGDIGIVGDNSDNSYTVVYMEYVDSNTVLDGLQIVDGHTMDEFGQIPILDRRLSGGGLYVLANFSTSDVNPTIRNCIFENNFALNRGGGVFVNGDENGMVSPYFYNCQFIENTAGWGGGLAMAGSSDVADWVIRECYFIENFGGIGGGIHLAFENGAFNVLIEQCNFLNGTAGSSGAGIHFEDLNNSYEKIVSVVESKFENNGGGSTIEYISFSDVGEIIFDRCDFTDNFDPMVIFGGQHVHLSNSIFHQNTSSYACLFFYGGLADIYNCLFSDNSGTLLTFFEVSQALDVLIANCTFYNNKLALPNLYDGLISAEGIGFGGQIDVFNTIFEDNDLNTNSKLFKLENSAATIQHCLLDVPDCTSIETNNMTCGSSMLYQQAPLFTDVNAGNYTLLPNSPAINAGNNTVVNNLGIISDLAGTPRIICGTVDMGAYETSGAGTIIYVNKNVQGGNQDGSSWGNAFSDLQNALTSACNGNNIWVAQGTYFPTAGIDRDIAFVLPNGIKLYGGFNGSETLLSERDWEGNPSILSGDIGVVGDSTDNSYTILYIGTSDTTTVVDGLMFQHGTANGDDGGFTDPSRCGGAIYVMGEDSHAYPRIRNCRFENNYSEYYGGAVYVNGNGAGSVAPQFYNCTFSHNHSKRDGGAIRRDGGSWLEVENDFWNCTFENNRAERNGGGVFIYDSERSDTLDFTDCIFYKNYAHVRAGGLAIWNGRISGYNIKIKGCSFEENEAVELAGALDHHNTNFQYLNSFLIENTIFSKNTASKTTTVHIDAFPVSGSNKGILIKGCLFDSNFGTNNNPNTLDIAYYTFDFGIEEIFETEFVNNQSEFLLASFGASQIDKCKFIGNKQTALINNHGTYFSKRITNSIFFKNEGQTILDENATSKIDTFLNCVFFNTINDEINPSWRGERYVANSIFVEDTEGGILFPIIGDNAIIENSLFSTSSCDSLPSFVTCGSGNLFGLDPMFVDTSAGDFTLLPCSPAINAGNNAIVNSLGILTDLAGNPRILGDTVDMGAYEHVVIPYVVNITEVQPPACQGETGSFSAIVTGGCGPYTVQFAGASTVEAAAAFTITGLPAGSFEFTITDSQGRTDTIQVGISAPSAIQLEVSPTPIDCATGSLGSAIAEVSGGTGQLMIEWDGGFTSDTVSGLTSGIYTVMVIDSLGCVAEALFNIYHEGEFMVEPIATATTCHDTSDGTATVAPIGTTPFSWLWNGGQTDSLLTGLAAGEYSLTVTDALGCTGSVEVVVGSASIIMVEIAGSDTLCFDGMDGEIAAVVTGGVPPYFYDWQNSETDSVLTSIGAGNYSLIVTDSLNCTSDLVFSLLEFPQITIEENVTHATGPTSNDGQIEINDVTGGKPEYYFLWSNGLMDQSLLNVPSGDYSLTITDEAGCQEVFNFFVDFMDAVSEEEVETIQAMIVPNPSSLNGAELWIDMAQKVEINLQIFDALGRQVFAKSESVSADRSILPLPIDLAAGVYWVVLKNEEGQTIALKWVVL